MKALLVFSCMAALVISLNACNRNSVDPSSTDGSARSSTTDSLKAGKPRSVTAIDVASLPTAVTTYINTNYAGATIKEAGKDSNGNFLVAISVSNRIKLLIFNADGTFSKEISGKSGHDHGDSAHHPRRDSTDRPKHAPGDSLKHPRPPHGDSLRPNRPGVGPEVTVIDVAKLPASITTYITTNYAGATIERAVQDKKSSDYMVMIKTSDSKRVLLLFGSDGTFKKAVTGK